jgi:hypothetical protein
VVFTKKIVAFEDEREFQVQIFGCIDRVFSIFGDSPKILLYHLIAKDCALPKDQFSTKPVELSECLSKILGETGYRFVEGLAIDQIQTTFKIKIKEGSTLPEAIEEARNRFVTC